MTDDWKMEYFRAGQGQIEAAGLDFIIWRRAKGESSAMLADWNSCRDVIMARWMLEHPGTRPFGWWLFDAPRQALEGNGCFWDGKFAEPRQRVGGVGTPQHELLNYLPSFRVGVPSSWVSLRQQEYYNGRCLDVDGNPMETKYRDGDFAGVAIDPNNPPVFECQAAYLRRHGLLDDAESKKLSDAAFQTETVSAVLN